MNPYINNSCIENEMGVVGPAILKSVANVPKIKKSENWGYMNAIKKEIIIIPKSKKRSFN